MLGSKDHRDKHCKEQTMWAEGIFNSQDFWVSLKPV